MTARLLLLCLSTSILLPACGTGSPEAYVEKSTKISCQYLKKCQEDMWTQAGYDSVSDCSDKLLEANLDGEGTFRDQFVDNCTDFDKQAAGDCLAAARKAKRECADLQTIDEPACQKVCGTPDAMGLGIGPDPLTDELVARALEQRVENGELELDPADALSSQPSDR